MPPGSAPFPFRCATDPLLGQEVGGKCAVGHESVVPKSPSAWSPYAALTGRCELISRKIVSSEQEQRVSRWADYAKNCLPWIECKELPRFRKKYRALGCHVCKIREIGGQKNGVQHATAIYPIPRYTRPRYIWLTLYCCFYVWFLFMDVYICVLYIYIFYCVSGHHGRTV